MNIDISDPAGKLPPRTLEMIEAYFRRVDVEAAAAELGLSVDKARAIMSDPNVREITSTMWTLILDDVAKNGGRMMPLSDDEIDQALAGAIGNGLLPDSGMTHDDWILSGQLDAPANSGKLQGTA